MPWRAAAQQRPPCHPLPSTLRPWPMVSMAVPRACLAQPPVAARPSPQATRIPAGFTFLNAEPEAKEVYHRLAVTNSYNDMRQGHANPGRHDPGRRWIWSSKSPGGSSESPAAVGPAPTLSQRTDSAPLWLHPPPVILRPALLPDHRVPADIRGVINKTCAGSDHNFFSLYWIAHMYPMG
jgi:hypothetical protein